MKSFILLLMLLAPCAVQAQSEVCDSSFTVNTVTMSTYSPFGSRSWSQGMKTYCITTGTNITGKVVLSQCK